MLSVTYLLDNVTESGYIVGVLSPDFGGFEVRKNYLRILGKNRKSRLKHAHPTESAY